MSATDQNQKLNRQQYQDTTHQPDDMFSSQIEGPFQNYEML